MNKETRLILESQELILRMIANEYNSTEEEKEISNQLSKLQEALNPTKQDKGYEPSLKE